MPTKLATAPDLAGRPGRRQLMLPVKYTFDRPHRTPVMKFINWAGGRRPPRQWSADEIVYTAARRSGVPAWDDHSFLEPLEVLVKSLEEDANLTPSGTLLMRVALIGMVINQISLQDWVRRHPEILAEHLAKPLMVIGMPRTGTTLLYNLLAQHSAARPLMTWESVKPLPHRATHGKRWDNRKTRARGLVRGLNRVAPQFQAIHPVDASGTEECTALMMHTFVSPAFSMMGRVLGYMEWHRSLNPSFILPRYEFYRRSLQLLQWEADPRHWVLKSPAHMGMLDAMLTAIPEACVVQLHRDMGEVLPSMGSLMAVFRGIYSDDVDPLTYGEREMEDVSNRVNECMTAREKHPGRVLDVKYTDLIRDPLGTTRRIHQHFDYEWGEEAEANASRWLKENGKRKHRKHRYGLEQFGVTPQQVEEVFGDYMDRFVRT